MQRVFDFSPAEHELVVSRILVQLHQAIDESFPHARPASQRFAKTAFVGSDEPTLTQLVPSDVMRDATQSDPYESIEPRSNKQRIKDYAEDSYEDSTKDRPSWWRFADNMPFKQTIIGILTLILVALVAYLLLSE